MRGPGQCSQGILSTESALSTPSSSVLIPQTASTGQLCQPCLEQALSSYLWHSGHATDEDDFPNVTLADFSILHGFLAGGHRPLDQVSHDALKLRPTQLHVQVLWSGGVHGQVGQVDVSLWHGNRLTVKTRNGLYINLQVLLGLY